jgi:3-deoxy-D-manno-octulosonic-acid transferase
MEMTIYSSLLALTLLLTSPWWLWQMATSGRYRAGLRERLGAVPLSLQQAVAGQDVIWVHAVSVGEVLAAEQMIHELQAALPTWVIAISTTTETGHKLAQERFPGHPVFFMPLDFAYSMRRYLRTLRPRLVVLMESELWPRMLVECERAGVPVVVANARISDRSFPRYVRLKRLWQPLLKKVTLFLAQGDESAERLVKIGVDLNRIRVVGNLKYDAPVVDRQRAVATLRARLPTTEFIVCGSTMEGEETEIIEAWTRLMSTGHRGILMIAPRHPQRFDQVATLIGKGVIRMSKWIEAPKPLALGDILLLDTLGSLAAVYQLATVAFLGGSLVPKGGHNPLEPARFGVPVLMGPSYENFREIVDAMRAKEAIVIVERGKLTLAFHQAMSRGRVIGRRGREFFESQTGATERTVLTLCDLLRKARTP